MNARNFVVISEALDQMLSLYLLCSIMFSVTNGDETWYVTVQHYMYCCGSE